jgi:hypothetical protein
MTPERRQLIQQLKDMREMVKTHQRLLQQAEQHVEIHKARLRDLLGNVYGGGSRGSIGCTISKIQAERYPAYERSSRGSHATYIRHVDDKWIYMINEYTKDCTKLEDCRKHRLTDGMLAGRRTYGPRIDVEKALAIWEAWKKEQTVPPKTKPADVPSAPDKWPASGAPFDETVVN